MLSIDDSKPIDKFVYEKADFEAMRRYLTDSNWEEVYLSSDDKYCKDLWHSLKSQLWELRNRFVPKRKISTVSRKEIGDFPIDKPKQFKMQSGINVPHIVIGVICSDGSLKLYQSKKQSHELCDIALKSKKYPKKACGPDELHRNVKAWFPLSREEL